jgi:muramoyltetrapeptide carboxypeptidase LdcA involved in peptidoglycan recycling
MRYPEFLHKGGTIGFVAPSFGCNIEPYRTAFENAVKNFKDRGMNVELGPNCYEGCGIGISNTPEKCGQEINDYYTSDTNDILISCGGGELMCETLNHIDFKKLAEVEPKWFMGYSDNTNLTFLLTTLCDTAAIYGPCAATFGMETWHRSVEDAYKLITGQKLVMNGYDGWEKESLKDEEHPLASYNITEPRILKCYNANKPISDNSNENNLIEGNSCADADINDIHMTGRLIGGCMDCLVNLLGTSFDKVRDFLERYKEDGFIWSLEACDLNVMAIRRAMWQMDNAGWFKYVKGFMIGRPLVFGQEMLGLNQYEAVMGIIRKYNVPVVMDADIGHLAPMMPLVSGSVADISVAGNDITVDMKLV